MSRTEAERYFGADIPKALWEQFEEWTGRHTKLTNRQILTGFFRLFLAAPETLQLKAMFSTAEPLRIKEMADDDDALSPEECAEIREHMRRQMIPSQEDLAEMLDQIATAPEGVSHIIPSEKAQESLKALRRELGPSTTEKSKFA